MEIEGIKYKTCHIPTQNTNILIISSKRGFLACGYINVEIADKNNDACAIITGIKTLEEMLSTEVKAVSVAAFNAGVRAGMKGKEALMLLS